MEIALTVFHIIVSLFLIVVVLLQTGKGAEIGAVLGGAGSQTLFGGSGGGNVLSKLTVYAAVLFMVTSVGLTYMHGAGKSESVMDSMVPPPTETVDGFPSAMTAEDDGATPVEAFEDTMTGPEGASK